MASSSIASLNEFEQLGRVATPKHVKLFACSRLEPRANHRPEGFEHPGCVDDEEGTEAFLSMGGKSGQHAWWRVCKPHLVTAGADPNV